MSIDNLGVNNMHENKCIVRGRKNNVIYVVFHMFIFLTILFFRTFSNALEIEDITRVVISYEIYQTSLRRV